MVYIHHQWQGKEDGPVLVLINGLLTDMKRWSGHLPAYTEKFRVLTYDCRGQGESDKPEEGPYMPSDHAEDLKRLLDSLGVERAAILGVSNGACIALEFAIRWPDRVSALVLANGYGRVDTVLRLKFLSWLAAEEAGGRALRWDVCTPWIWGATFLDRNLENLRPSREKGSVFALHAIRHLVNGCVEHDVLEQTTGITCPTLLMTGDEDIFTPSRYSYELHRRIAGSEVVIMKEAGHCMLLEQTANCTRVVTEFLTRHLL